MAGEPYQWRGYLLSYVTGMDLTTSKLVAVLAFGIYVIIGGYLAVVWTD